MKIILAILAVCFAVLFVVGLKFKMEEWTPASRAARAAREEANNAALKRMADDEAAVKRKQADDDAVRSIRMARDPQFRKRELAAKERSLILELQGKCSELYRSTADTKLRDLTVKQTELIGTCRQFGMYRP